ncbi:hypothetical protein EGW08_018872, partial [Elysia chlorotica]
IIIIIISILINVQVLGQHPHQWTPFQVAGLLHAWLISHQISRCFCHEGQLLSFQSFRSLSVTCFHVILGLPFPRPPVTCMSNAVLIAPLDRSTWPYHRSLLSFRMRFRKRDLLFGGIAFLALVMVLILAIVLAVELGRRDDDGDGGTTAAASTGSSKGDDPSKPVSPGPVDPDLCVTAQCLRAAHYHKSSMDEQVAPCEDFYTFACGHYDEVNYVLSDVTPINKVAMENFYKMVDILSFPVDRSATSSYERKLKHFWSSCTNHFDKMELRGRPLVERVLRQVGPTFLLDEDFDPAQFDLNAKLQQTHIDFWTAAFFTVNVVTDQTDWTRKVVELNFGGLAFEYQLYLHNVYADMVLSKYSDYMTHVLSLVARDADKYVNASKIETMVNDVIEVEQHIALLVYHSPVLPAPHLDVFRMPLRNLTELAKNTIDFTAYMKNLFNQHPDLFTDDTTVSVKRYGYFHHLGDMLSELASTDDGKRKLSNYLVWVLINRYSHDLNWDYVHAKRDLDAYLYGQKDTSSGAYYCFEMARMSMAEAMDAEFVKYYAKNNNKPEAENILNAVQQEMLKGIAQLNWMTEENRETATKKIKESLHKIGYADYMVDDTYMDGLYAEASISESDYFGNILNLNNLYRIEYNRRVGEQNSRTLWVYHVFDPVVEYYNPWQELIATSAIFQDPLFNHDGPAYYNFGSVGSMMAKHLIHAVDEIGSFYRLDGAHYGDWWANVTYQRYLDIKTCAIDAQAGTDLGKYEIRPDVFYTPNATLYAEDYAPEMLADASGLKLAYEAFKQFRTSQPEKVKMPVGFPGRNVDQLFFLAFAQMNCQNTPPSIKLRQLDGNVYPSKPRVNLAVSQVAEFADVFKCSPGQPMAPKKRCTLF